MWSILCLSIHKILIFIFTAELPSTTSYPRYRREKSCSRKCRKIKSLAKKPRLIICLTSHSPATHQSYSSPVLLLTSPTPHQSYSSRVLLFTSPTPRRSCSSPVLHLTSPTPHQSFFSPVLLLTSPAPH